MDSALRRFVAVVGPGVAAVLALAALVGAGYLLPERPAYVLLAAIVLLLFGLSFAEPAFVPLIGLPLYLAVSRVAVGGTELAISDLALFVAFWPAIVLAPRPFSPAMRSLLWLSTAYQATLLFALVANPYRANYIEWAHEWLLVTGALVVGWTIGRRGFAGVAFSVLLLTGAAIALATIWAGISHYVRGDFGAVYVQSPLRMHKNFIGTTLCMLALVAWIRPGPLQTKPWIRPVLVLLLFALAMSQSRQAVVGLAVAATVVAIRRGTGHGRAVITVGALVTLVLTGLTVRDQVFQSANRFNSANQRLTWFGDAIDVWGHNPLFGVGLRWWYTARFPSSFQPPNAILEVGSSAGVVGLAGFALLMIGAVMRLSRVPTAFGLLSLAVLINRLVQGQLDIFWVAVTASLPFLIIGICLGAIDNDVASGAHPQRHMHDRSRPSSIGSGV